MNMQQPKCYTFRKHRFPILCVSYIKGIKVLLSLDISGHLIKWDMSLERQQASIWKKSDICQRCHDPFFWKVKSKIVQIRNVNIPLPSFNANRQHHCRKCGLAVCSQCCVKDKITLPYFGFENPVYVCKACFPILIKKHKQTSILQQHNFCNMLSLGYVPDSDIFLASFDDFSVKALTVP